MTHFDGRDLHVFPDADGLSRGAAEFVAARISRTVVSRGSCSLVLSGGATPAPLYAELASAPFRNAVEWPEVHIFWSDERCVPSDHPESNFKLAFDALLSRVPLPAAQVHRIRGEEGPDRAAELYEKEILGFAGGGLPAFDLVLLGVGEDGHTASLFPNSALLHERRRLALPVRFEPPRLSRVTLSLPVLNNAGHVLFLAAGRSKAAVVHEIMENGNPKGCPAGLVRPVPGGLTWMLDHDAALALTGTLKETGKEVKTG